MYACGCIGACTAVRVSVSVLVWVGVWGCIRGFIGVCVAGHCLRRLSCSRPTCAVPTRNSPPSVNGRTRRLRVRPDSWYVRRAHYTHTYTHSYTPTHTHKHTLTLTHTATWTHGPTVTPTYGPTSTHSHLNTLKHTLQYSHSYSHTHPRPFDTLVAL